MRKIIKVLIFLLLFCRVTMLNASPSYYGKHIVIVVDQSQGIQTHSNMSKLFDALSDFLMTGTTNVALSLDSNLPDHFTFNPETDQISLFVSSIKGSGIVSGYDYSRIVSMCNLGNPVTVVANEIVNSLIHPRADFQSSGLTLRGFLDEKLKPMMNHQDPLLQGLPAVGSISLNPFLYPLVLLKVDKTVKAQEYYIFTVSSFVPKGNINDLFISQVHPLCGNRTAYIDAVQSLIAKTKKPFYTVGDNKIQLPKTTPGTLPDNNNPMIGINRLGLVCLQKVGMSVQMVPTFKQDSYHSSEFEMSKSIVRFDHDSHIVVERAELAIRGAHLDSTVVVPLITDEIAAESLFTHAPGGNYYTFDKQEVVLSEELLVGDQLNCDFIFYARTIDDNNELLPFVFKADGSYVLREGDIAPNPADSYLGQIITTIIVLALIALIYILNRQFKKRGKERKAWVNFRVRPVSNARFMEVRNKEVVNEDCWYLGPDNQNQKIAIEGQLSLEQLTFGKNYKYRLEYWISDADSEEDFSFRPDGTDEQGRMLKVEEWYKVDVNSDGSFKFNVYTFLDTVHSPHLKDPEALRTLFNHPDHLERILKLQIKFRILVLDSAKQTTAVQIPTPEAPKPFALGVFPDDYSDENRKKFKFEEIYSFIVKPDFDNKDTWVAFDPGTSGSCAAFACQGFLPGDLRAVSLAKNQYSLTDTEEGRKLTEGIFPSIIKITDRSRCFKQADEVIADVRDWKIGVNDDFIFGNMAEQRLGNNRFQSVKKLLGYTTQQDVIKGDVVRKIAGKHLAHLIVKGLYQQVGDYAETNKEVDETLRDRLCFDNGHFSPQRAIVAVPNNYTLSKVQEMIDSVKDLGYFKEVHYLYESEGVMMRYLHKMWSKLYEVKDKLFIVYDMGGATINATAFTMEVKFDELKNPDFVKVRTVAKIGYCVGGDDIDYALIRILYDIPSVNALFSDEEAIKENMKQNKQKLTRFVTKLKLELIEKAKGSATDNFEIFVNEETLLNAISTLMKECGKYIDPTSFDEVDKRYLTLQLESQQNKNSTMYRYVYSKVIDAVQELLCHLPKQDFELIFSGRSSLYPHVQTFVKNTISGMGFSQGQEWDGFNAKDGYLDAEAVKTAVAQGACWYAVNNYMIRLDHDVITSTFGYIDQVAGEPKFVPVIKSTERFEDSRKENAVAPIFKSLVVVRFVQMLGSDYDKILTEFSSANGENKHKMNELDVIPASIVNGSVQKIKIKIDDKNNFTYEVETSANMITPESNRYSRLVGHSDSVVQTEIKDENNESYTFAALVSVNEHFDDAPEPSTVRTTSRRKRIEHVSTPQNVETPWLSLESVTPERKPTEKKTRL